uniref:Ovule protein n=1 Tax=Brugia timori TaxID=42155 RepID=A0A0R3QAS1_9BILA
LATAVYNNNDKKRDYEEDDVNIAYVRHFADYLILLDLLRNHRMILKVDFGNFPNIYELFFSHPCSNFLSLLI